MQASLRKLRELTDGNSERGGRGGAGLRSYRLQSYVPLCLDLSTTWLCLYVDLWVWVRYCLVSSSTLNTSNIWSCVGNLTACLRVLLLFLSLPRQLPRSCKFDPYRFPFGGQSQPESAAVKQETTTIPSIDRSLGGPLTLGR